VFEGTISAFIFRDGGKPRKTSVSVASSLASILTENLWNPCQ